MIAAELGRRLLLAMILVGFVLAMGSLWWTGRNGAISQAQADLAINKLFDHYVPLLGVLAGFYFSERSVRSTKRKTSLEALVFALTVQLIWSLGPVLLIVLAPNIEAALRLLNSAATVAGTALASASLAFYFSASSKHTGGS